MRVLLGLVIFLLTMNSWAERKLTDIKVNNVEDHFIFDFNFSEEINTDQINVEFDKNGAFFVVPEAILNSAKGLVRVDQAGVKSILATQISGGMVRAKIFFKDNVNPQSYINSIQLQKTKTGVRAIVKNSDLAWSNKVLGLPDVVPQGLDPVVAGVMNDDVLKEATLVIPNESNESGTLPKAIAKDVAIENITADKTGEVKTSDTKNENQPLSIRKESEIPVLTKEDTKKANTTNTGFRLVLSFALIISTGLGLAVFGKWYKKRTQKDGDNNQIRILTQHYLGPKKSLAIVRVAGETILIGVTEQNISMIKSLSLIDDEFPETNSVSSTANKLTNKAFASELNEQNQLNTSNVKVTSAPSLAGIEFESTEEFVLSSIKNKISNKLKNLRPLG
jgi:flagellar protein FliO/FliZ